MASLMSQDVSAAVLTGGKSSRMGRDKALVSIHGETILGRVIRVLSRVTSKVMIVGERDAYRDFGVPVIADVVAGAGPLGGILTALSNSPADHMLIVGCDMPLLNGRLLQAIATEPRESDVLVPYLDDDSDHHGYQPLHALYSVQCIDPIMARLKRGDLKIQAFLEDVDTRLLRSEWLRQFDPDLRSFINVNTPAELLMANSVIEQSDTGRTGR
jgi:molybdenum cofactor guanylyltransferase